jgi:hypothetical protein
VEITMRLYSSAFALLFVVASAWAGESNPPVRPLGDGKFQIGGVILDPSNRTIRLPGIVNLHEETTEYALVHKSGKTHESILRTDARPRDIHMALLLIGAKPMMTNSFGSDGKALPRGEKVWIEASWTNDSKRISCPLEDLVLDKQTRQPMPRGDWIFNGSNFSEGSFTAERDGSIISTHIDPDALINNPRQGRENDDLYKPNPAKLPRLGALVEITIRLSR